MTDILLNLRTIKSAAPDAIVEYVRQVSTDLTDRTNQLLDVIFVQASVLQRDRDDVDRLKVLQSAVLAVVLSSVSVHNPYARREGVKKITDVCHTLGLRYEDVLALTAKESAIASVIA